MEVDMRLGGSAGLSVESCEGEKSWNNCLMDRLDIGSQGEAL